jgi:hypothetical protein
MKLSGSFLGFQPSEQVPARKAQEWKEDFIAAQQA